MPTNFEKVYPAAGYYGRNCRMFAKTGEFRPPRKHEYYLSGANPEVYQAFEDYSAAYYIMVERPTRCPSGKHPRGLLDIWKGDRITGQRLVNQCDCRETHEEE
jgi:hypothetical protein